MRSGAVALLVALCALILPAQENDAPLSEPKMQCTAHTRTFRCLARFTPAEALRIEWRLYEGFSTTDIVHEEEGDEVRFYAPDHWSRFEMRVELPKAKVRVAWTLVRYWDGRVMFAVRENSAK